MFRELLKYKDKNFYDTHRSFRFDTLYQTYECEVFAVFKTHIDFYYIDTQFNSDQEWMDFMKSCYDISLHQDSSKKFYPTDIVLTLSTCAAKKNERFVVMAKIRSANWVILTWISRRGDFKAWKLKMRYQMIRQDMFWLFFSYDC